MMTKFFERKIFRTISGREKRGVIDEENETCARKRITNTSSTVYQIILVDQ